MKIKALLKKNSNRGFTLLEIMVAAGILVIAITGLLSSFVYFTIQRKSNDELVTAVSDAQYVLEQIKGVGYSNITNYTAPTFGNLKNESVNITTVSGNRIMNVTVNVTWMQGANRKRYELSTRIAK